jgi:hypothetical protein
MFESIEKYNELCKSRPHPTFWHHNLIDSERLCKDNRELKHFMNYITNPQRYSYDVVENTDYRTLGDSIDAGTVTEPKNLPSNVHSFCYKNGNEYRIINKVVDHPDLIEDEKNPL